jgi:large repetitive protein
MRLGGAADHAPLACSWARYEQRLPSRSSRKGKFVRATWFPAALSLICASMLDPDLAHAQATRTWVSGASTTTISISTPGQHGTLAFRGAAGQKVSVEIDFSSMTSCNTYSVLNPDGSTLVASNLTCDSRLYATGAPIVLPQSGLYTIPIVPVISSGTLTAGTGSISSTIFNVPADATGSVTIGGTGATLIISTPGQHGSVTFSGSSGQRVNVQVDFSNMTPVCNSFNVLNPDNSTLFPLTLGCSASSTPTLNLSQTGTYTVGIIPDISGGALNSGTGSLSVTVASSP